MATEPTPAEYQRYFELSDTERELTAAEIEESEFLDRLVRPWLYSIDCRELAIDGGGLLPVVETFDDGGTCTHWITDRFTVVPAHRQRQVDGHTKFLWAVLPLDEQPTAACSLVFEDGKFRPEEPERLGWQFDVWIYYWGKGREAFKRHFGADFASSKFMGEEQIEEWIASLNI